MAVNSTNYKFNTPDNGSEEDTWGDKLNENWDKMDSLLYGASYTDSDGNTVERIQPDLAEGSWAIAGTSVTATAAELNYVDGVTSSIQTQLDAKANSASPAITGDGTVNSGSLTFGGTLKIEGSLISSPYSNGSISVEPNGSGSFAVYNQRTDPATSPYWGTVRIGRQDYAPADGEHVGEIEFWGLDDNNVATQYAYIRGTSDDVTGGSENGAINFYVASGFTSKHLASMESYAFRVFDNLVVSDIINGEQLQFINTSGTAIGSSVDIIRDEDSMTSNDANALATQQSIKSYVDTQVATAGITVKAFMQHTQAGSSFYTLTLTNVSTDKLLIIEGIGDAYWDSDTSSGFTTIYSANPGAGVTEESSPSLDLSDIDSHSTAIIVADGGRIGAVYIEPTSSTVVFGWQAITSRTNRGIVVWN